MLEKKNKKTSVDTLNYENYFHKIDFFVLNSIIYIYLNKKYKGELL